MRKLVIILFIAVLIYTGNIKIKLNVKNLRDENRNLFSIQTYKEVQEYKEEIERKVIKNDIKNDIKKEFKPLTEKK